MRLIDADALIESIKNTADLGGWIGEALYQIKQVAIKYIDSAPTIEPKHGEWIDKGWKGDWQFETDGRGNCWYEYECSECGFHSKGSKSNFCPNCGADMREREGE